MLRSEAVELIGSLVSADVILDCVALTSVDTVVGCAVELVGHASQNSGQ